MRLIRNDKLYNLFWFTITAIITGIFSLLLIVYCENKHYEQYNTVLNVDDYEVTGFRIDMDWTSEYSGYASGIFTIKHEVDGVIYIGEVRVSQTDKHEDTFKDLLIRLDEDRAKRVLGNLYYDKDNPNKIAIYR